MIQRADTKRNGGAGGSALLAEGPRPAESANLLRQTLEQFAVHGIPLTPEMARETAATIKLLQDHDNPRYQAAGAKLAIAAARFNLDLFLESDRIGRLDTGRPTENVRVFVATFDKQG